VLALEEQQLRLMLPSVRGKWVLDLACGTGRWLEWLMEQGADAGAGVDFSPAMLAAAQKKPTLRGRLVQADCRAIPFANADFDIVICSFAVGHIADLWHVAREVARVAKPTADIYVTDLHPCAYEHGWQTGFRDQQGPVEIATWPRSTQEFLAPWMSAGFDCAQTVECRFGEPERVIFNLMGKGHRFDKCRLFPAVLAGHFVRPRRRMSAREILK